MEVQHPEVPPPASTAINQAELPAGKPASWLVPSLIGLSCIYPLVGERLVTACNQIFYPAPHGQMVPPPEYMAAVLRAMTVNTAIGYGVCGALFFLLLGGLVGAASGVGRTLRGALIGAVVGFMLAAAAAAFGYQVENFLLQEDIDAMYRTGFVLIAEFIAFAVTGGIIAQWVGAKGTGARGDGLTGDGGGARGAGATLRTLGTALLVAIIGIVGYILIATIAIPTGWTEGMHPTEMSVRYLFFLCLGLAATGTVALLLKSRSAKTATR